MGFILKPQYKFPTINPVIDNIPVYTKEAMIPILEDYTDDLSKYINKTQAELYANMVNYQKDMSKLLRYRWSKLTKEKENAISSSNNTLKVIFKQKKQYSHILEKPSMYDLFIREVYNDIYFNLDNSILISNGFYEKVLDVDYRIFKMFKVDRSELKNVYGSVPEYIDDRYSEDKPVEVTITGKDIPIMKREVNILTFNMIFLRKKSLLAKKRTLRIIDRLKTDELSIYTPEQKSTILSTIKFLYTDFVANTHRYMAIHREYLFMINSMMEVYMKEYEKRK